MPSLELTVDQVIELVKQLPVRDKQAVLSSLHEERRAFWDQAHKQGEQQLRRLAAERGRNWDALTEEERLDFVDDLLHEDR